MKSDSESAVSPVVGVMLMLVVTIIIAAVVAGFSGSLTDSAEKPKTVTLKATYSQSQGMTIEHGGGDVIGTTGVQLLVRPTNTFGDAAHRICYINPAIITNDASATNISDVAAADRWVREAGYSGIKVFAPGDTNYIPVDNCGSARTGYFEPTVGSNWQLQANEDSATYTFKNPANLGRTFYLEMMDSDGRMITKTEVVIEP